MYDLLRLEFSSEVRGFLLRLEFSSEISLNRRHSLRYNDQPENVQSRTWDKI